MQLGCDKFMHMGIVRKTKAVKILLRQFEQQDEAVSVVDLVEQLKGEMNKTTVYRILDRLESDGIVHSFNDKDGLKWYAKCTGCSTGHHTDAHPHFQCRDCGKIECIAVDITIPALQSHQIESAEVLLIGKCNQCTS